MTSKSQSFKICAVIDSFLPNLTLLLEVEFDVSLHQVNNHLLNILSVAEP